MNVTTGLKRTVGGVVAATAVLAMALIPSGSAMATPTSITVDPAATAGLSVKGTRQSMAGHTFKAVQLASYSDAQAEGTELASVSVTSNNTALATGLDTAYTAANSGNPVDAGHVGNIMSAVTEKWLGFTSSVSTTNEDTTSNNSSLAWTGKLRNFVTNLVTQPDFTAALATAVSASGPAVGAPGNPTDVVTANFTALPTGLYLIVDTTGSPTAITGNATPAAIPMLAGTVLKSTAPQTYDHFANDSLMVLGSVTMKSNTPTLKKKISAPSYGSASIGDTVTYQLLGSIPLTTGFTHFTYKLTDTPAAGLTYQATPTPLKVDVVPSEFGASVQSLTLGVDYTFTPPTNPGDPIIVNLSPGIVNLGKTQYGKYIRVEYVMKINNDATNSTVSNGVKLAYSNDPSHPTNNDNGDDTGGNGSVSTIDATDPGTLANVYFYSFTMETQAKINAATKLSGATFKIYDSAHPTVALKFQKLADGSYKKVSDDTLIGGNIVDEIVSANGGGAMTKGQLKVDGLGSDTYTVKETAVPVGYSGAFASTFTVTMNTNSPNSAAQPAYSNTSDGWLLVQGASWPYTAAASHIIVVQEVTSFSQLPMTGGAGAIVVGLVVVVLLGGAGALFFITRRGEKSLNQEG